MAGIRLESFRKVFGEDGDNEIVAVDNLDLEIKNGEFLILVGPSGCGKTTTLRGIGGLESASGGKIYFDDTDVTELDAKDRNIAMVFQNYALYPHMTARENMSFSLKHATNLESSEIRSRVEDAGELLDIEDLLDKKPGELSGGQQQRVALGRSIVREPEVFLMDEPLSNLDAKLRASMRTELQELHDKLGITTIYVTHDQEEAMTMGDRVAIMKDGKLQQVGTPLECYHHPENQFVAGFIGSPSMNFFDVVREGDAFHHSAFDYSISSQIADQLPSDGENFVIGIRPEDIELRKEPGKNTIPVEAKVIEPMGDRTNIFVDIGEDPCTVNGPGDLYIEEGEEFFLQFPENRLHVFDARSGETIKNRDFETSRQSIAASTRT